MTGQKQMSFQVIKKVISKCQETNDMLQICSKILRLINV